MEMDEREMGQRGRALALSQSHPDKAGAGHSCPDLHPGAQNSPTGVKNSAMAPLYDSSINFRTDWSFSFRMWLLIGASVRAAAAPITASPLQRFSPSQVSAMSLSAPMPLSLVRQALTPGNPGKNDPIFLLPAPPLQPSSEAPPKERQGKKGSGSRIWRAEFISINSLSSPSRVCKPQMS